MLLTLLCFSRLECQYSAFFEWPSRSQRRTATSYLYSSHFYRLYCLPYCSFFSIFLGYCVHAEEQRALMLLTLTCFPSTRMPMFSCLRKAITFSMINSYMKPGGYVCIVVIFIDCIAYLISVFFYRLGYRIHAEEQLQGAGPAHLPDLHLRPDLQQPGLLHREGRGLWLYVHPHRLLLGGCHHDHCGLRGHLPCHRSVSSFFIDSQKTQIKAYTFFIMIKAIFLPQPFFVRYTIQFTIKRKKGFFFLHPTHSWASHPVGEEAEKDILLHGTLFVPYIKNGIPTPCWRSDTLSYTFYIYNIATDNYNQLSKKVCFYYTLQRHCAEKSKKIFPEMKLRGPVPNSYIHVSVRGLFVPTISPPVLLQHNRWPREKVRGGLVHKRGQKHQHDWLYLQPISSIKHQ